MPETDFEAAMRDVDIARYFVNAATVVLYTMAGLIVTPGKFFIKHDRKAIGYFTAAINVSGHRIGTIAVSFTRTGAATLARGMLGDDVGDLEHDMLDAVGEVTNMIAGQARAAMAEAGVVLRAGTPTVMAGDDIQIEYAAGAPIVVIPFAMSDSAFTVKFCLSKT
ncbi:MAG: chemotaxis protein CheX [Deltaproteobacteria bacterium]|jgi:chemotaxis protein CheX|nr:chemotaxis protein CheX [Deltaproteobacteria bacterium]